MKLISDRISDIKKELDELEKHVNSTISILDCKKIPLIKYDINYVDFKWKKTIFAVYYEDIAIFKDEAETLSEIEKIKIKMDEIKVKNEKIISDNKETLDKICNFFEKLGLNKTTYAFAGKGKNRRSYQVESEWLRQLKNEYKIVDDEYEAFLNWYKKTSLDVNSFWIKKNKESLAKQFILAEQNRQRLQEEKLLEDKKRAIELAKDYLKINNITEYNDDDAIELAHKVRENIIQVKKEVKEEIIESKTNNLLDHMKIDEE